MSNCVIYARFSSYGQNEQSIEGQIRICKEFAESKGFNVVNIYPDRARTGTNDNRPSFQRMIADAGSGTFQYVIVYMFDRFARNRRDSIIYKEMLKEKYGIRVLSALEPVADDEGGEFYEMFLDWNAEKYSKRLSKRVKDGLDTSVANGTFCGGHLLFGYEINVEPIAGKSNKFIKKIIINEEEAKIIRYIFEEYDKGISKKTIADELNKQGYRCKGNLFDGKSFGRYLTNDKYTGEFYFGGRVCNNMYPAIISKQLFIRVQERLKNNRHIAGGMATAKLPYLLTGKLFCGHCGSEMVSDGGTSKLGVQHHYYACKKKKKSLCDKKREDKDKLERFVTDNVIDFLRDKKNAEIVVDDVISYYDKKVDENALRSIAAKINSTKKEVEKLADAFVNSNSTLLRNTIEKKMSDFEVLLNDLYTQQAQLELERGYRIVRKDLLDFIDNLIKCDKDNKEYQKLVIDHLVTQVIVSDGHTVVYLNISGGKNIEKVSIDDTQSAVNDLLRCSNASTIGLPSIALKPVKAGFFN